MWFWHYIYEIGLLITFYVGLSVSVDDTEDLARGWNANIEWVKLKEAETLSRANSDKLRHPRSVAYSAEQVLLNKQQDISNKPVMLLIHKSWCGACKALRPRFAESKEIEELSKDFVMVNTLDDEEPSDAKYSPDGGYIPRILFIDQRGTVLQDIINKDGNDRYKYYYHDPQHIVSSMRQCLEMTKHTTPGTKDL